MECGVALYKTDGLIVVVNGDSRSLDTSDGVGNNIVASFCSDRLRNIEALLQICQDIPAAWQVYTINLMVNMSLATELLGTRRTPAQEHNPPI